jgi:hypothetical protein
MTTGGEIRLLGATFLPLIAMALYTWALYAFRIVGRISSNIDLVVLFGLLIAGALVLYFGPWTRRAKLMMIVAYVPVMLVFLAFASFVTNNALGGFI